MAVLKLWTSNKYLSFDSVTVESDRLYYDTETKRMVIGTGNGEFEIINSGSGGSGDGYTGSKGDIGYTGSKGDIGYTGSKGDIGFTGSQGIIGPIGYTGSAGGGGSGDGYTGSKGDIGFTGSQGDTGFTGSQGFTGSRGINSAVIYDAGTPYTDFSIGVNINCGGVT
jgi:hypothetical protein